MKTELSLLYDNNFIVKMRTTKLFENSMKPNLFNSHLLLRYYVVKCYVENQNTDYAFELYNEMQLKRVSFKPEIPREKAYNEVVFKKLIDDIRNNGFDEKHPILINNKLKLFDGSHRLAIALYLGLEFIPVKILEEYENNDFIYDISWFKSQCLERQIEVINLMKEEIQKKYNLKF